MHRVDLPGVRRLRGARQLEVGLHLEEVRRVRSLLDVAHVNDVQPAAVGEVRPLPAGLPRLPQAVVRQVLGGRRGGDGVVHARGEHVQGLQQRERHHRHGLRLDPGALARPGQVPHELFERQRDPGVHDWRQSLLPLLIDILRADDDVLPRGVHAAQLDAALGLVGLEGVRLASRLRESGVLLFLHLRPGPHLLLQLDPPLLLVLNSVVLGAEVCADHADRHRQHDDPVEDRQRADQLAQHGRRIQITVPHGGDRHDDVPEGVDDAVEGALLQIVLVQRAEGWPQVRTPVRDVESVQLRVARRVPRALLRKPDERAEQAAAEGYEEEHQCQSRYGLADYAREQREDLVVLAQLEYPENPR
mmetsp:Transcript_15770/g.41770  ORF Transcript_15770/g.41770 Transcript_15770/m.41770 type:complete len:360 (+) Transcript_15770:171-1250(+)